MRCEKIKRNGVVCRQRNSLLVGSVVIGDSVASYVGRIGVGGSVGNGVCGKVGNVGSVGNVRSVVVIDGGRVGSGILPMSMLLKNATL